MADVTLVNEIIADLKTELQITDSNFNESLLSVKVNNAYREVKKARCYPSTYTDVMINSDMENYYSNIRDLALYDYNQIGAEFQTSSTENSVTRQWATRDSLLNGVIGIAKV